MYIECSNCGSIVHSFWRTHLQYFGAMANPQENELVEDLRVKAEDFPKNVSAMVKRGPDWKWDDEDGGDGGFGTILRDGAVLHPWTWVVVKWNSGVEGICRTGAEGKYDLEYVKFEGKLVLRA